ncbi:MAG: flagellar protein FlaG [Oscillospiraceae bacterium]|nr:flagellar protein FlaG [Oscillospiraceae bacterium]
MFAGSMEAFSKTRQSHSAGLTELRSRWRTPNANKVYKEHSLRWISPDLRAREEEKEQESLRVNPDAIYESRRFLLSERMAENVVSKISSLFSIPYRHLQYNYHEESGEYFVRIIDDETDEIIREIPPKKILDIYASLQEIIGLLFDARR